MNTWTIKKRIVLSSGFFCAVIAAISLFSITQVTRLNHISDSIVKDSLPGVTEAGKIRSIQGENQILLSKLLRIKTPEERQAIEAEMARNSVLNNESLKKYEASISAPEDRDNFEKFAVQRQEFLKLRGEFFSLLATNRAAAGEYMDARMIPGHKVYAQAGMTLLDYNARMGAERGAKLSADVKSAVRILIIVAVSALVIGIVASFLTVVSTGKVLRRLADALDTGAEQVTMASSQLTSGSQSLAEGASEQAASLEETSASLEEISSMTRRNADNAESAKSFANQTRAAADIGATDMQEMSTAMGEIKGAGDNIAKIIKTIDEIAFQTNILALNAAVEAARAGEAGMGFAVVADEVRNLAQRSAQAARETAASIEDSIRKSERGVQISGKVGQSLGEIVAKARKVDEIVAEIALASREQSQGISQVNIAMTQMDKVTQSTAATAEESAAAAEELNSQAQVLKDAVEELSKLVGDQSQPVRSQSHREPSPKPRLTQSAPAMVTAKSNRSQPWAGNFKNF